MSTNGKANTGGVQGRSSLYAYVSKHTKEAIDVLVEIMRDSRQPAVRMAAARSLLDKTLPDVKAVEVTGTDGGPITLTVIAGEGFIPQVREIVTAPAGSVTTLPAAVQSPDLAQASPQDDDSNQRDSQAGAS